MATHCKSCGAEIVWTKTAAGRRMPLDAKPEQRFFVEAGKLGETRAHSIRAFACHFATCPNAEAHRKN